ncbi:MAG: hypothetical protein GKR88_13700 [Flavobacteriaceae bacterium]|nr:MAG: hypothetical protein GKR88_13700 [Flavobacteriaceae bacterium]
MKKSPAFMVKTKEPIHNFYNAIYLGKGASICLLLASRPMILALRKKYLQNKHSLQISKRSKRFLFSYNGFISCNDSFY